MIITLVSNNNGTSRWVNPTGHAAKETTAKVSWQGSLRASYSFIELLDSLNKMFGSSRAGGVRGGQDQFNWDDVKVDKHRENYLGKWPPRLLSAKSCC